MSKPQFQRKICDLPETAKGREFLAGAAEVTDVSEFDKRKR